MASRTMYREFQTAGPTDITVRWCRNRTNAGWKALTRRQRIAWILRQIADLIEGDNTQSYTLQGKVPAWLSQDEHAEGFSFGVAAMQQYFADLEIDKFSV